MHVKSAVTWDCSKTFAHFVWCCLWRSNGVCAIFCSVLRYRAIQVLLFRRSKNMQCAADQLPDVSLSSLTFYECTELRTWRLRCCGGSLLCCMRRIPGKSLFYLLILTLLLLCSHFFKTAYHLFGRSALVVLRKQSAGCWWTLVSCLERLLILEMQILKNF